MSGDDNVVLFPKARDDTVEPPVERKKKPRSFEPDACSHRRKLVLDEQAHQLRCDECGQVLDPFDWMVDYMAKWAQTNTSYRQAKQQAREASEELAKLERKVKARRAAARRPGVLLTSGDARLLRDQFDRLMSLVLTLTRDREDALRRAHLHGWDPKKAGEAYRRLSAAVEMRNTDEDEAAV